MIMQNDATRAQVKAARPDSSTWLAANAGSGKTRVLTDRVARLLLDGVSPQNILCLTYTKAAASEMQNRLFQRLGRWTMLEDTKLRSELAELGVVDTLTAKEIAEARTLFARAVEAPGGLKIQTIHSFCAAILRRFPLEAGVSPQFTEIDERAQALLLDEVVERVADVPGPSPYDGIAAHFTGYDLHDILGAILSKASLFSDPVSKDDIWQAFSLGAGYCEVDLEKDCFAPGDLQMLQALRDHLLTCDGNDLKSGAKLAAMNLGQLDHRILPALEGLFLFGAKTKNPFSAKIGTFPTKKTQANLSFMPALDALMSRVEAVRQNRLALIAAQRTNALHDFAQVFLAQYQQRKLDMGLLDFDDLIQKTRALLSDEFVAAWVLFRLDGGIDHILVDEAQDTSPAQWDVIKLLAQEFTSGQGARADVQRTIFVVGDKKQSIYSFQGADPEGFDTMRDRFHQQLEEIDQPFQSETLDYSFRSSPAILSLVDTVFQNRTGLGTKSTHLAFKANLPGRVDVWPVHTPPVAPEKRHWTDTVDEVSQDHQDKQLAKDLAQHIKKSIETETLTQIDKDGQPYHRNVQAGDFLILVQGRQRMLFREIHRACKDAKLPIAGADRLKVAAELAVQDLRSLLAFLALPEDNLSLAEALRSPLFGWSEQDIYSLAQGRDNPYLWRCLLKREDEFPKTAERLKTLRKLSDFKRPFEVLEHILVRQNGRANLLARLGGEASEGIDALVAQALAYERGNVPSLTGFLTWLDADDLEIKRQMDGAGDQIRVMTVHGAKGLEAPIVILPDTAPRRAPVPPSVIDHGGLAVWRPNSDATPDVISPTLKSLQDRQIAERDRLLYVALTRAESWLIVFGSGDIKDAQDCWYNSIRAGVDQLGAAALDTENGLGLRYQPVDWVAGQLRKKQEIPAKVVNVPEFYAADVGAPVLAKPSLSPSDLGGAKVIASAETSQNPDALKYGVAIHKLLEILPGVPPADWRRVATHFLDVTDVSQALAEVSPILSDPALQHLFAKNSFAEVDISAHLQEMGGDLIQGSIDRLVVTDTQILAVDYKTNQAIPKDAMHTPEGLLRQMGAYAAALARVYPNHEICTAILWTKTAKLMPIPHHLVTRALQNTASS